MRVIHRDDKRRWEVTLSTGEVLLMHEAHGRLVIVAEEPGTEASVTVVNRGIGGVLAAGTEDR